MDMGRGIESLYANPTRYGMEKGIKYSKALGADKDHISRHATVIFPFYTQTGGPGMVRQEFQIRVPVDDTNTYHINYGCYMSPEEVPAPVQERVPYYEVPLFDDEGSRSWTLCWRRTPTPGFRRDRSPTGRRSTLGVPTFRLCS